MKRADRFPEEVRHQASGQAALMLLEGLLLDLVEKNILAADDLVDTIQAVADTKRQLIEDKAETDVAECAISMLVTIENSLLAARGSHEK